MRNMLLLGLCAVLIMVPPLINSHQSLYAEENTVRPSSKRTAVPDEKTWPYVVKKGEWIYDIMRKQLGITSNHFAIIKKYNPHIKDLDKVHPGQIILLPKEKPTQSINPEAAGAIKTYTTKRGDSINRIVSRQLNVKPADVKRTISQIEQLNPHIKDWNKIRPGQVIYLPRKSSVITRQTITASPMVQAETKVAEEMKMTAMPPATHLDSIRDILERMNGFFAIAGKHYIPIPETGQITIDCSMIPVAELEDGSVVLIDFTNRISESLKNTIQSNWKNYHVVKSAGNESIAAILQKIINASNDYIMTRESASLALGKNPTIKLNLNGLISKKTFEEGKPYSQGLLFVSDNSHLLPPPIVAYAEKNGLVISEIMDGRGLARAPAWPYKAPEIRVITGNSGTDLAHALLVTLGYAPVKEPDVIIFDSTKDGSNLTMKADLLVKKGDRHIMIHSKQLPQQFTDTLKKKGTDVTFIEQSMDRKAVIDKTLQIMNIPYTFDNYSFSAKTGQPGYSVMVSAFKVLRDKGFLYLIDFDMDHDLYSLLHHTGEVSLVKY